MLKNSTLSTEEIRVRQALNNRGTGLFTCNEDRYCVRERLTPTDWKTRKIVYGHLDVDSEYQSYPLTKGVRENRCSLVGAKDWVSGNEYLLEGRNYEFLIDDIYGTKTFYQKGRCQHAGKFVPIIYFFYAANDIRFLFGDDNHSLFTLLKTTLIKRRNLRIEKEMHRGYKWLKGWYTEYGGILRRFCPELVDICGMFGEGSLEEYAKKVGLTLSTKHLLDDYKTRMNDVWADKFGDELKYKMGVYCLGDLSCREIVHKANTRLTKIIQESLGINIHFKGTTGSTVSDLLEKMVSQYLVSRGLEYIPSDCKFKDVYGTEREVKDVLSTHLFLNQMGTAHSLRSRSIGNTPLTSRWLAKVDGGRAKNELPSISRDLSPSIVDMDLGGAYATELIHSLTLPFGSPEILEFTEKEMRYSLRKILAKYEKEFVDGLWYMRVSSKGEIPYQTLVQSQILPNLTRMSNYEPEEEGEYNITKISGSLVVLAKEIIHGTINSTLLKLLRRVCTKKEMSLILDNLVVEALIYYPRSKQVKDPNIVSQSIKNGTIDTYTYDGVEGKLKRNVDSYWFGIPLREIVEPLLNERKKYSKKTPENELYKLLANTVYGVLASVYFNIGNACVASNLTANIRAKVWCLSRACRTYNSITDGGAFNINLVHQKPERVTLTGLSLTFCEELAKEIYQNHISEYLPKETPLYGENVKLMKRIKANIKEIKIVAWDVPFGEVIDYVLVGEKTGKVYATNKDNWSTVNEEVETWIHSFFETSQSDIVYNLELKDIYTGYIKKSQCDYILFYKEIEDYNNPEKSYGVVVKTRGNEVGKRVLSIYADGLYESSVSEKDKKETWLTQFPHPIKDVFYYLMNEEQTVPDIPYGVQYRTQQIKDYRKGNGMIGENYVELGNEYEEYVKAYPISASQFVYCTKHQLDAWKSLEDRWYAESGRKLELLQYHWHLGVDDLLTRLTYEIAKGLYPKDLNLEGLRLSDLTHQYIETDN